MTPPQMSGPAPAGVLGRAHANVSCQELRPTHTLGQERTSQSVLAATTRSHAARDTSRSLALNVCMGRTASRTI